MIKFSTIKTKIAKITVANCTRFSSKSTVGGPGRPADRRHYTIGLLMVGYQGARNISGRGNAIK
jgi:hypothetical protein